MTDDPYSDQSSGVLYNRLGIVDAETLRRVEADLTHAALADLGTRTLPGDYDLSHLQSFREGNGRAQRAFSHQLARQAGWSVDWSRLDPEANTRTSVDSIRGDNTLLRVLLDNLVGR